MVRQERAAAGEGGGREACDDQGPSCCQRQRQRQGQGDAMPRDVTRNGATQRSATRCTQLNPFPPCPLGVAGPARRRWGRRRLDRLDELVGEHRTQGLWLGSILLRLPTTSYDFLLHPMAPSVCCPCMDALLTRSSKLPPSPAFPRRLPLSTSRLSLLPNHRPKVEKGRAMSGEEWRKYQRKHAGKNKAMKLKEKADMEWMQQQVRRCSRKRVVFTSSTCTYLRAVLPYTCSRTGHGPTYPAIHLCDHLPTYPPAHQPG